MVRTWMFAEGADELGVLGLRRKLCRSDMLITAHAAAPRARLRTSLQEFASASAGPGQYSSGPQYQGYGSQGGYYGHQGYGSQGGDYGGQGYGSQGGDYGRQGYGSQGGYYGRQGHYDYGASQAPAQPPGPYGPDQPGPGATPAKPGEEPPPATDAAGNQAAASSASGDAETAEAEAVAEGGEVQAMPPEEFYDEYPPEDYPPEDYPPEEMYPEELPPEEAAEPQALVIQVPGISNHLYESYPTGAMLGNLPAFARSRDMRNHSLDSKF
eukprot:s682_g11.t1